MTPESVGLITDVGLEKVLNLTLSGVMSFLLLTRMTAELFSFLGCPLRGQFYHVKDYSFQIISSGEMHSKLHIQVYAILEYVLKGFILFH